LGYHPGNISFFGDIRGNADSGASALGDESRGFVTGIFISAHNGYSSPFTGEGNSHTASNSAAAPGDDGDLIF
jgi:hypothetical protein